MEDKKKVYLASPLGFTQWGQEFVPKITKRLEKFGYVVISPWEIECNIYDEKNKLNIKSNYDLAMYIGKRNKELMNQADEIFAILDGPDVDSGTASEIGYAFCLGKRINGLRTDKRKSGEDLDVVVNLQVQYWIEESGGKIFKNLEDIEL